MRDARIVTFHTTRRRIDMYRRAVLAATACICCLNAGLAGAGLKATDPEPADRAKGVLSPLLRWAAGDTALWYHVYLGTSPVLTEADRVAAQVPFTMHWHIEGITPGTTYYWRVDAVEADTVTIHTGNVWSFTVAPMEGYDPMPWDSAKYVRTDLEELTWTGGYGANAHDVYFGTDRDGVAARDAATFQGNQSLPAFTLGALQGETTYYWAVDEYDMAGVKTEGPVWSFTTLGPGGGVRAEYFGDMELGGTPVLTQVEDAIDHSWGSNEIAAGRSDQVSARWTADLEAPLTETFTLITTSDDGVRLWFDGVRVIDNWTNHGSTDNMATVDLVAGQVYSVRMEWYEDGGGAVAQLSWESETIVREIIPRGWLQLPRLAAGPFPRRGSSDVSHDSTLRWDAGPHAAGHDVYFGTDRRAVANATPGTSGVYVGRQALEATTFDPGQLEWNTAYYWRVDEVNDANPESPWRGSVWSFTTAGHVVVDDFEAYTNEVGQRIFEVWVDGVGFNLPEPGHPGNGSGATCGHDIWSPGTPHETLVETRHVYGGRQALPLDYNNVNAPFKSEIERTWANPQNWTVGNITHLAVNFRGSSANDSEPLYVTLQDAAGNVGTVAHPDPARVAFPAWTPWSIAMSQFSDAGVDITAVTKMIIGLGDAVNSTAGGAGTLYIDELRVAVPATAQAVAVFAEDFEGVELGPNVEEGGKGTVQEAWTDTPPSGWVIDESGVPGVGDPAVDGVTEWAGWAIADKQFWINTDGQRREEFTLGQGNVAVADCDEWDDSSHPAGYSPALDAYDTWMTTPAIDISTIEPGTLKLTFDSSWRPEHDDNYHQSASLTVSFDDGPEQELFLWVSDGGSPNFKDDNSTNETITVEIEHPADAKSMKLTFGLFDAGNDWWWAIDNILITGAVSE
jgi:hypothetical protein